MRRVPERFWPVQILTVFAAFILGPLASLHVARYLAPDAAIVQDVSAFIFALAFVGATLLWTGIGVVSVIFAGLRSLLRGRRPSLGPQDSAERLVPPGYGAYIAFGCLAGALAGGFAGVMTELTLLTSLAVWTGLGTLYGSLLWTAAHNGYLPFLEPE